MSTMKTIATLLAMLACGAALASGGTDLRLDPAPIHRLDAESLQVRENLQAEAVQHPLGDTAHEARLCPHKPPVDKSKD